MTFSSELEEQSFPCVSACAVLSPAPLRAGEDDDFDEDDDNFVEQPEVETEDDFDEDDFDDDFDDDFEEELEEDELAPAGDDASVGDDDSALDEEIEFEDDE